MIDPGQLYDWMDRQDIEIIRHEDSRRVMSREEFEDLFRAYIEEVTSR